VPEINKADAYRMLGASWRIVDVAAAAALLLEFLEAAVTVWGTDPALRAGAALLTFGLVVLIGLVVYGLRRRAKWSAYAAAVLAVLNLLTTGIELFAAAAGVTVMIGSARVIESPLTRVLGLTKAAAYAALLVGLIRVVLAWRRARRFETR
jgi:hypothetical protein